MSQNVVHSRWIIDECLLQKLALCVKVYSRFSTRRGGQGSFRFISREQSRPLLGVAQCDWVPYLSVHLRESPCQAPVLERFVQLVRSLPDSLFAFHLKRPTLFDLSVSFYWRERCVVQSEFSVRRVKVRGRFLSDCVKFSREYRVFPFYAFEFFFPIDGRRRRVLFFACLALMTSKVRGRSRGIVGLVSCKVSFGRPGSRHRGPVCWTGGERRSSLKVKPLAFANRRPKEGTTRVGKGQAKARNCSTQRAGRRQTSGSPLEGIPSPS